MVVSLLQIIVEIPDIGSLKDKRRIVKSLKDKAQQKFKISIAEVDLQNSLTHSQIGAAVVSNSRQHGERIMQKVAELIEEKLPGRMVDLKIVSEFY